MTHLFPLDRLRELREAAGLTQADMARLCGLRGQQSHQTAGAWERGTMIPHASRRAKFIGYLWDHLRLRDDPAQFEAIWELLVEAWGWEPLTDAEWASFTRQPRPRAHQVKELDQKLARLEEAFSRLEATAAPVPDRPEPRPAHPHDRASAPASQAAAPPGEKTIEGRTAYDAVLYTQPGNAKTPNQIFGRHWLLIHITAQLQQGSHVLLTGLGGAGKTALAATVADQWMDAQRGPVLWLAADEGDLDVLLEAMVATLDRDFEAARWRGDARIAAVRRLLAETAVGLVVLDNLGQIHLLAQLRQAIPPGIPLLVTSRYDAANMDESIKLANLEPVEACALLAHHAQNDRFNATQYQDDPHTRELCARLAYHPLGLVIAGAWLKQSRRPPVDLVRRLDQTALTPLTLVMPPAARLAGPESVERVLDQTEQALSPQARLALVAMGELATPQATAGLISFYVAQNPLEVENALDELVAWHFLDREGSDFYSMHEMIHGYARGLRARYEPLQPERPAHVPAIARFVDAYAQDYQSLQRNLPNVLHAAAAGDDPQCLAIITPLAAGGFLDVYGYRLAVMALLDRALAYLQAEQQAGPLDDHRRTVLHVLLSKRGNACFDQGDYDQAYAMYHAALTTAPNHERRTKLMSLAGKALAFGGDAPTAAHYFEQAQALAADHDYLQSFVLEQEAHAAGHNGDHATARRVAAAQLAINRRLLAAEASMEHYDALFRSLINLGTAELRLAQVPVQQVLAIHEEAMALAQQHDNDHWRAHALWALAEDYHVAGDRTRAEHYLNQALAYFQAQNQRRSHQEVAEFMRQHGYEITDPSS